MNLFRSEGHARKWQGFAPEAEGGLVALKSMMTAFSAEQFRERLNGHYVSSRAEYRPEFIARLREVTGGHPFWSL
jgi:hypothetical protein